MAEVDCASLPEPPLPLPSVDALSCGTGNDLQPETTVEIDVDGSQGFIGKKIEPLGDRPGTIRIRSRCFAEADLAEIAAPPVRITQAADDPYRYHLILLLDGYGTYHWSNRAITQSPGDLVLLDTAQRSQLTSPVDARLLRLGLPETLLAPFLPARDCAIHLCARQGLNTLLTRHLRELAREAARLDRSAQCGLLAHFSGLLGLAVEAGRTPRPTGRRNYRAYQRQRILSYIEANLSDGRLTAGRAAGDLGMSPRWLHALLEDVGIGFSELVARRRLEKGRRMLEEAASRHLSIAEIAFQAGFNDLSTFYRRFGERYSMTPGEVRRTRPLA